MSQFDDMIPEFVAESRDLMPEVEQGLLALENDPLNVDPETVNTIFRAIHSVKGGASFVGLHRIEQLSHKMEDLLNLIRNGDIAPSQTVSSELLRSLDVLNDMLDRVETSNERDIQNEVAALQALIDDQTSIEVQTAMATSATSPKEELAVFGVDQYTLEKKFAQGLVYLISFDLVSTEEEGFSPLKLIQELTSLGEIIDAQVQVAPAPEDPFEVASLSLDVLFFSVLEEDILSAGLSPEPQKVVQVSLEDFQTSKPPAPPIEEAGMISLDSEKKPSAAKEAASAPAAFEEEDQSVAAEAAAHFGAEARPGEYLTFFLGEEEYAVETANIQEIISLQHIARLPRVPPYVKGMINLRGMVVPVVDLREKFGLEVKKFDKYTVIIVVEVEDKTTGLIVDSVSDVNELTAASLHEAPEFARSLSTGHIKGLGRLDERFLILLDLKKLLGREEMVLG